jgi:hypothetical protein
VELGRSRVTVITADPNVIVRPSVTSVVGVVGKGRVFPSYTMLEGPRTTVVSAPRVIVVDEAGKGAVDPSTTMPGEVTMVELLWVKVSEPSNDVDVGLVPATAVLGDCWVPANIVLAL